MALQTPRTREDFDRLRRSLKGEAVAGGVTTPRVPRSASTPGGVSTVNQTMTRTVDQQPRKTSEDQSNSSTSQVTPENTLRGRRIHFNPRSAGEMNAQLQSAMSDLLGGTDRQGIVRRQWESMLPRLNEMADRDREDLVKRNVALGRTGSGVFTRNMGDLERRIARDRETMLGQLVADASDRSVGDRFRAVGMGGDLSDRLYRQDLGEANWLRGERGDQNRLAREATAAEQSRLNMLRQLGFMGDPSGAEQDYINILGGQAAGAQNRGDAAAGRQGDMFSNALQLLYMGGGIGGGGGNVTSGSVRGTGGF